MREYPKDKLYLRVGNLITRLRKIAYHNGNIELYQHLINVSKWVKPSNIEWVIITEKHILSPDFFTQNSFKEGDIEEMKVIIREYKLNQLI
jgi:hypothetical protein